MPFFRSIFTAFLIVVAIPAAWCADAFWEAVLTTESKGNVVVKLADVSAVALHTYKLNGVQEITECTIDTKGSHSIRFFAMAGGGSKDAQIVRTALGTGQVPDISGGSSNYPARKFPEGAYSHNIEYQLKSPAAVHRVFKSIKNAWLSSSSTTIKNID